MTFKYTDDQLNDLISRYCTNFTELAKQGRYDPITGRDEEILNTMLILLQKGRKNVMLQAPAGVGKTALCVGLAQTIVSGNVPDLLKDAEILELDLANMAAGTSTVSEFQGNFIPLVKAIAERYHAGGKRYILFIDEIHQIMPTCEGSSYKGLSEVMKPYLTAGALYVIGATTEDEYRQYIAVDPAMDRRFQKINLSIPDDKATTIILNAIKPAYEKHHGITIPEEMCSLIVKLTSEHIRKRYQPDKSITTMDAACAHHVMAHGRGGALSKEAVHKILSIETGIHPDAL
ncbi:MAG: Clp protease [Micavibrio sp.]|nr:Clp protease [Micavibrio sp.]|tara:strand:+ start:3287 stop:4153 length:867 start_codon:yes stop_codon:yes gene_type:complete